MIGGLIIFQILWHSQQIEKQKSEYYIHVLYVLNRAKRALHDKNNCVTFYSKPSVNAHEAVILLKQKWNDKGYFGKADTISLWLKKEDLPVPIRDSIPLRYQAYHSSLPTYAELSLRVMYSDSMPTTLGNVYPFDKILHAPKAINFEAFYQFLKDELLKEGIQDSFGFGLKNMKTGAISSMYRIKDSTELHHPNYSIDVWQQDEFTTPHLLSLVFYTSPFHPWQPTWALLSLVALVLLFILLLYFYRFYKQQRKLSQLKSDFIHNMNHEMKTPITNILLVLESLTEQYPQASSRQLLEIASKEAFRLQQNVDKTLQLSVLENEELHLHLIPVNIKEVLGDVLTSFQPILDSLDKATCTISGDDIVYKTDRLHFTNIISALLDNAIKYRRHHVPLQLKFTVKRESNFWILSCCDNGIGMSADVKKQVFDKFYRAETGLVHNTKGFGLGLNYVKTFVELNSGSIWVNSKINEGSCFELKFPMKN